MYFSLYFLIIEIFSFLSGNPVKELPSNIFSTNTDLVYL